MYPFVGLVVFTVGLALFVFPDGVVAALGERPDRQTGHREKVAARGAGLLGMALGGALLLT